MNMAALHYDILIIGGGINGAAIARDAAGRDFSVCLCEADDFGGGTSSASSKLVHGGLRYLEHYAFGLVRSGLKERRILWQSAPHIIYPMRFIIPHHRGLRSAWLMRLGLFLYDHLGGKQYFPSSRAINLTAASFGAVLKPEFRHGFEYSDCWVDDSRLVILNLRDAAAHHADIRPRTEVTQAHRRDGLWDITLHDRRHDNKESITAKIIINATGPWSSTVLQRVFGRDRPENIRLVRGSHIIIGKKFNHNRCYVFQHSDGRIIFAIPYEDDFTLIGTTDVNQSTMAPSPQASWQEIAYLCAAASEYFAEPVREADVLWSYSGVRALLDNGKADAQRVSRDYSIARDGDAREGLLLNIIGGKITTCRHLAEAAVKIIEGALGKRGPAWTATAKLSGGNFDPDGFDDLVVKIGERYPFLEPELARRLARLYGTEVMTMLGSMTMEAELGHHFGGDLYEAELRYLMDYEWAQTVEDVLFRRTKLRFRLNEKQKARLAQWMEPRSGTISIR